MLARSRPKSDVAKDVLVTPSTPLDRLGVLSIFEYAAGGVIASSHVGWGETRHNTIVQRKTCTQGPRELQTAFSTLRHLSSKFKIRMSSSVHSYEDQTE